MKLPEAVYNFKSSANKAIQSPVSSAPATKNVSESAPAPTYQQAIVDMLADDEKLTDDILANRVNVPPPIEAGAS